VPAEPNEATCNDGLDNDCDGDTDCTDGDCDRDSCDFYGSFCFLYTCCYPTCICECGWNDDGCGTLIFCGDCGGSGTCNGCYCMW